MGYWFKGPAPRTPHKPKKFEILRSRRGPVGETWWGKKFAEFIERVTEPGRVTRGKSYARNGNVGMVSIKDGVVSAQVAGSYYPYRVQIMMPQLSPEEWERVLDALSSDTLMLAQLLAGDMTPEIEGVVQEVGLHLFPGEKFGLKILCTCSDWMAPCKHIVALYYLLVEKLDEDPFLLFNLRGMSRDQILAEVRRRRDAGSDMEDLSHQVGPEPPVRISSRKKARSRSTDISNAPQPKEAAEPVDLSAFFDLSAQLTPISFRTRDPVIVEAAPLRRLGPSLIKLGGKDLADRLAEVYPRVRAYALQVAAETPATEQSDQDPVRSNP
ncbi:MAG TPA: hypothetical protein VN372_04570 [Methanospirillum sp.]|nr:hypothetical protein [Methanospirillum sp.]